MLTVDGLFLRALERDPGRAFCDELSLRGREVTTYGEQAWRVANIALGLRSMGLGVGDRVLLYLDDLRPTLDFLLGACFAGVVCVPLAPAFTLEALGRLGRRVDAKAVLVGATSRGAGAPASPPWPTLQVHQGALQVTGGAVLAPSVPENAVLSTLERLSGEHGPNDAYAILPTSGTSGEPKLILRLHSAFADHRGPVEMLGLVPYARPPERVLMVAALTHGMGHVNLMIGLTVGATFVVPSAIDVHASVREIAELAPTYAHVTPRVVLSWHRQLEETPAQVMPPGARLRVGGSACDPEVLGSFQSLGIDVGEVYGSTELGVLSTTPPGGWRPGYGGRVVSDAEVRVSSDGELLGRSPRRMTCYLGDQAQTEALQAPGGFLRTGDLGEVTADGYVRVAGRRTTCFNTYEGTNVYPERIEALLESLPWVGQAVLLGDQRPYMAALLFLKEHVGPLDSQNDYLRPEDVPAAYANARADLGLLNRKLEPIERVRRFALFAGPLGPPWWQPAGHGKVRRDRPAIAARFSDRIAVLYAASSAGGDGLGPDGVGE